MAQPAIYRARNWRQMMAEAVTPEDQAEVVRVLVERAKAGRRWAIRELMDRMDGTPQQTINSTHTNISATVENIEALRAIVAARRLAVDGVAAVVNCPPMVCAASPYEHELPAS